MGLTRPTKFEIEVLCSLGLEDTADHMIISPCRCHLLRPGGITLHLAVVRITAFFFVEVGKETLPFCFRGCLWPANLCLLHVG